MTKDVGPITIPANEAETIRWLHTGGGFTRLSIQFVAPPSAWDDLILTLVTRVNDKCTPIAVAGVSTFTSVAQSQFNIDVSGLRDIGLKVTTVEGEDIELDAYAHLGDQSWPSA